MTRRVPGTLPTAIVSAAWGIVLAVGVVWAVGPWAGGQRESERQAAAAGAPQVVPRRAPASPADPAHHPAGEALQPVLPGDKAAATATPAGLAAALGSLADQSGLGKHVGIAVADAANPTLLYDNSASDLFAPASTNKVVTAVAALAALGPDKRLTTKVVAAAAPAAGSAAPVALTLVGGGDPTLSTLPPPAGAAGEAFRPASVDDLAAQTAAALGKAGVKSVTVAYDTSLFSGSGLEATWPKGYTDGNVAPVSALEVDEGRTRATEDLSARVADPAAAAGLAFAAALEKHGLDVAAKPASGAAPGAGAVQLAAVSSPRMADLVEHMLTVSDNDVAEALLRQVAVADGRPASFEGGTGAVRDVLGKLGLDLAGYKVVDGSGLSRQDRVEPGFLVRVLSLASAAAHPELRAAVTGLPVAGFTGTLAEDGRYQSSDSRAAAGLVRAKTGSLTGVATLAGVVRDKDGQLLVFALMADRVADEDAARSALDRLAAGISACGCGGPGPAGGPTSPPTP